MIKLLYNSWVREEADLIRSDGCTLVSEMFHQACLEHDCGYFFGKDPRDAYHLYLKDDQDYWTNAKPISRGEVDKRFRNSIQAKSKFGRFSPVGWTRWIGVRIGGYFLWKHK